MAIIISRFRLIMDLAKVDSSLICKASTRHKICNRTKCKCSKCSRWCSRRINNRFNNLNLWLSHNLDYNRVSFRRRCPKLNLIISSSSSRCSKCSKNPNCHKHSFTRVIQRLSVRFSPRKVPRTCSQHRACKQNLLNNNRPAILISMGWLIYHWQESKRKPHRIKLPQFLTT
jgi:hypothetical protein